MGTTPAILGAGLALGAVSALALTLVASVRRRRREFALLKTLGFVRRQLAAAVAWQSSIAVAIGVLIGVPVGVLLGRILWDLFAHEIDALPMPDVPGPPLSSSWWAPSARQRRRHDSRSNGGGHVDGLGAARRVAGRAEGAG